MTVPTIEVSELYVAPQGEGVHLGRMSLFLRLRRCTLSCGWCDSANTWNKNDPEYSVYARPSVPQLAEWMVNTCRGKDVQGLVITGGEPLIWQHALPDLITLFRSELLVAVEVETSGTITPSPVMLRACHFNISHKLASSGNTIAPARLWRLDAMNAIVQQAGPHNMTLKPVVDPEIDRPSLRMYLAWLSSIEQRLGIAPRTLLRRVYLMPQARTRDELIRNQPRILEMAEELGVNATTRMQMIAHGAERRV